MVALFYASGQEGQYSVATQRFALTDNGEDCPFQRGIHGQRSSDRMNHQYSLLFEASQNTDQSHPFVKSDEVVQSKASVSSTAMRTAAMTAENWRKRFGREHHTSPTVLTWRQAIFTCSVHSKGPQEKHLKPTIKINILCNDGRMSNHKIF